MTNTFFYRIQMPNFIRFSGITKYQISNSVWYFKKIGIPNTKYYSILRKSKYRIQEVLFSLNIRIPNTEYRIIYKVVEKMQLKSTYLSHTRHFFLKFFETIWKGIWSSIRITEYYSGCKKTNTTYYLVLRKSKYRIQKLLFRPTIRIVFEF